MKHRIDELRKSKGLTVVELAERAGTSFSQMNKLRRGERRLTSEWMERLAAAMGCAPEDIISDRGEAHPLPIYGEVPGGAVLKIEEPYQPTGYVHYHMARRGWFALKVRGNSMNMIAPAGQYVVVDPTAKTLAEMDGRFVIANLRGECTFKRLRLNPLRLEPYSNDPTYETIYPDPLELHIVGQVVGAISDLR